MKGSLLPQALSTSSGCLWSCQEICVGPKKRGWDAAVIFPLIPLLCLLISTLLHFSVLAIMVINSTITMPRGHLNPCAVRCCLNTCAAEHLQMGAGLRLPPRTQYLWRSQSKEAGGQQARSSASHLSLYPQSTGKHKFC